MGMYPLSSVGPTAAAHRGGARAGRAAGTSLGRPRWCRIRSMTLASSMRAISAGAHRTADTRGRQTRNCGASGRPRADGHQTQPRRPPMLAPVRAFVRCRASTRHDLSSPRRSCTEHPVVKNQVDPGPGSDGRQALEQLHGIEQHMRGAVRQSPPELQSHLARLGQPEAILGEGRSQGGAADALEPGPVPCRNHETGVPVKPGSSRVGRIEDGQAIHLRVPNPAKRSAGARAECHTPLHGRRDEAGQHRRLVSPRVRCRAFVRDAAARQQPCNPPLDCRDTASSSTSVGVPVA